jgi:small RNA 2'-O-methyltransferase
VLDIGCGEGGLLSCLANPASSLPPTSKETAYDDDLEEIHLTKLGGLDIDASALEWAVTAVSTSSEGKERDVWHCPHPRWESLDVKLWHASFEESHMSLCCDDKGAGYECIVSTEVYVKRNRPLCSNELILPTV